MAEDNNIARSIRVALAKRGLKATDIAVAAGTTGTYLNHICRGHSTPSQQLLERIAKALGMKLSELIALGEDE